MTKTLQDPQAYRALTRQLKRAAVAATVLAAVVIVRATLSPANPQLMGAFNDKLLHFAGFAGLVLPCAVFLPRSLVIVAPLAVALGGAIELIQPSVGRTASWWDFWADVLGVAAGILVGLVIRAALKRYVPAPTA